MNWLIKTIGSSIGKKVIMALTGFAFCGFLAGHLAGNLSIFGGKQALDSYAEHLHSLGPLINLAEISLLVFFTIHIVTGLILFFGNLKARPKRYVMKKNAGGRTIGSATMPYTGLLILFFVVCHLMHFHFVDKTTQTISQIVFSAFSDPVYITAYVAAMIVVALHVSHGFWSAFQTIGVNHVKYMPVIRLTSTFLGLIVAIGFGSLPVYILLFS